MGAKVWTMLIIWIMVMLFFITFSCSSSSSSSTSRSSSKAYTCDYCGKKMNHYYDYFNGKYACRECSKKYRR